MKQKLQVVLFAVVSSALVTGMVTSSAFSAEKKKQQQQAPAVHHEEPAHHSNRQQPTSEDADSIPDTDSCGLGWQVTQKKTLSATTTRGTTNAFVPPTFGMTTGTLGCAQHPLSKRDVDGARYAYNNFDVLSIEMAEGQGEFLTSFARTLGCDDASLEAFSHMTQSHYRSIMNEGKATRVEMFDNIKTEMKNDPVLSARCNAV
jgi:hypothetical protein